jgi:Secretion system C-terminal sorting domain
MKKLRILPFIFCLFTVLYGQNFAPIGTKWAYNISGGFLPPSTTYVESVSDTIIKGRTCRKLLTKNINHSIRFGTYEFDELGNYKYITYKGVRIIHERNDSLFEVDNDNNFALLFHYKLQVGDTLSTNNYWSKYIVTNKGDTLINGQLLKKWNLVAVCKEPSKYIGRDVFIEKIGTLSDISLKYIHCITNIGSYDGTFHSLCQFSSENIKINYLCEITATRELSANISLLIYPNPATTALKIVTNYPFIRYKIYDIHGKILQKSTFVDGASIDITALDNGVYFLMLMDKNQGVAYKKFVKVSL